MNQRRQPITTTTARFLPNSPKCDGLAHIRRRTNHPLPARTPFDKAPKPHPPSSQRAALPSSCPLPASGPGDEGRRGEGRSAPSLAPLSPLLLLFAEPGILGPRSILSGVSASSEPVSAVPFLLFALPCGTCTSTLCAPLLLDTGLDGLCDVTTG